jgi:ribosomal protein S18 acetylase RimI-like enzyme
MNASAKHLLDNIMWNSLTGPHARFASGMRGARRYSRGFSPIVGFRDPESPDFAALAPFCEPGEQFYCDIWSGPAPPGWQIDKEATMFKMVWEAVMPENDDAPDAVPLGTEHAAQAVELATLTNPGPFGLRTIELGEYFGYFEGSHLIAMAGERMAAGSLHEVSGICTHPTYRGRGLAHRLTSKLVRRQLQRAETPFLHVMSANVSARALYEKMGFRNYCETVVRVISPIAGDHNLARRKRGKR